jgi:hypothetical protein
MTEKMLCGTCHAFCRPKLRARIGVCKVDNVGRFDVSRCTNRLHYTHIKELLVP